ncbi:hypothetical protein LOTGIDRAFT_192289 [Lottia gigantea]|uniref:Uncharacterized protein n=1 Tax=Lottia gigantea TaxID=225164 RepID=V3ZG14_LOTGI|nr:hypothetical protein LOTGIDRAFT_192289 [Lottia gigantea]ESO90148.1 hypothetical protein LOTGIDRAFT_192289 [Lottia gigantea]
MIDVHAHLTDSNFEKDIATVISDAKIKGVIAALAVTITKEDFVKVIELQSRFPDFIVPCLGLHPVQGTQTEQRSLTLKDFDKDVELLIDKYKDVIAGIGEIGLDFSPRFVSQEGSKDEQKQVFIKQVDIAKRMDLTVNVHSRSAGRPTIALLKELGVTKAHLHAFDGKPSVAMEGVRQGYYFSIPPSIVRSEQKQKLISQVPLENLLLETDSPALGPVKQERNVPSNLNIVVDYIAKVKKIDPSEVKHTTSQNAIKLYPKLARLITK